MSELKSRQSAEAEFYDHRHAKLGDDQNVFSNQKFYSIAKSNEEYVRQWLAQRCKGKRVLDYCCGNGEWAIWLAEMGADAVGIDISPGSIDNARKEASVRGFSDRARFEVMDAEATEFDDSSFDYAVISGVLHHLDLNKAYRELARILKPEGEAIATEALRHNMVIHLYRKMTPHLRTAWEVEHILGRRDILKARSYFDVVEVKKFFHLFTIGAVPFRKTVIFEALRRGLESLDAVVLRLPGLKWQAWMAVFVLGRPRKVENGVRM